MLVGTGLGDDRRQSLLEALQSEAAALRGEMMLGQLCEVAKDHLSAMNYPEGDCAICLHLLTDGPKRYEDTQLQKLPCFHCFHLYVPFSINASLPKMLKFLGTSEEHGFDLSVCPIQMMILTPLALHCIYSLLWPLKVSRICLRLLA